MSLDGHPRGVLVPAVTPFHHDLSVDVKRFVEHCRWLLAEGASGLAVFGTTSEANALSIAERTNLLERLIDGGIPASVLLPGTGCCALPDTVALTKHATERGSFGVLMLPPFYYKGVSDEGLYASVAEVVDRVGDARLRIYLYHIPSMAGVGFSLALIERLLKSYKGVVVGIKDSSGDWKYTKALLDGFPGFEVFPGAETYLLDTLRAGGAGCISATANVNVAAMDALIRAYRSASAEGLQRQLTAIRAAIQKYPLVSANKAILARIHNDESWDVVRPPLVALGPDQRTALFASLDALGFKSRQTVAAQ